MSEIPAAHGAAHDQPICSGEGEQETVPLASVEQLPVLYLDESQQERIFRPSYRVGTLIVSQSVSLRAIREAVANRYPDDAMAGINVAKAHDNLFTYLNAQVLYQERPMHRATAISLSTVVPELMHRLVAKRDRYPAAIEQINRLRVLDGTEEPRMPDDEFNALVRDGLIVFHNKLIVSALRKHGIKTYSSMLRHQRTAHQGLTNGLDDSAS